MMYHVSHAVSPNPSQYHLPNPGINDMSKIESINFSQSISERKTCPVSIKIRFQPSNELSASIVMSSGSKSMLDLTMKVNL